MEREQLEWIAGLCNLSFTEDEFKVFEKEFHQILKLIDELKSTTVEAGEKWDTVLTLKDLREDTVKPSMPIEEVLMNAPKKRDRYFVVPQVVE